MRVVAYGAVAVAAVAFLPWLSARVTAKWLLKDTSNKVRRGIWMLSCYLSGLLPIAVLVALLAGLNWGIGTKHWFGSNPGNNLEFGIVIAAVGAFFVGQIGMSSSMVRNRIINSLGNAIPNSEENARRVEFNAIKSSIEAGSREALQAAIDRILA